MFPKIAAGVFALQGFIAVVLGEKEIAILCGVCGGAIGLRELWHKLDEDDFDD